MIVTVTGAATTTGATTTGAATGTATGTAAAIVTTTAIAATECCSCHQVKCSSQLGGRRPGATKTLPSVCFRHLQPPPPTDYVNSAPGTALSTRAALISSPDLSRRLGFAAAGNRLGLRLRGTTNMRPPPGFCTSFAIEHRRRQPSPSRPLPSRLPPLPGMVISSRHDTSQGSALRTGSGQRHARKAHQPDGQRTYM